MKRGVVGVGGGVAAVAEAVGAVAVVVTVLLLLVGHHHDWAIGQSSEATGTIASTSTKLLESAAGLSLSSKSA